MLMDPFGGNWEDGWNHGISSSIPHRKGNLYVQHSVQAEVGGQPGKGI